MFAGRRPQLQQVLTAEYLAQTIELDQRCITGHQLCRLGHLQAVLAPIGAILVYMSLWR